MTALDTDHLSVMRFGEGARCANLLARMEASGDDFGTTIVCVEEQMRGWLASIAKERQAVRQVNSYRELGKLFEFFARLTILPFDEAAALKFDELRSAGVRIGTPDLKIAAVCLVQNVKLLTANSKGFAKVPGLCFENWLD